jgi:hypothetical protein
VETSAGTEWVEAKAEDEAAAERWSGAPPEIERP